MAALMLIIAYAVSRSTPSSSKGANSRTGKQGPAETSVVPPAASTESRGESYGYWASGVQGLVSRKRAKGHVASPV